MKITAATINRELKKVGINERLVQGRGYVYFVDGEASSWYSSSIAVCYVSDLVQETLEKTMAWVLTEHADLRGCRPGRSVLYRDERFRVVSLDHAKAEAVLLPLDRGPEPKTVRCGVLNIHPLYR